MQDDEGAIMLLREHLHTWFQARGFAVSADGAAIADSGYGSGGIEIDLAELEKEVAEAVVRRLGAELNDLRRAKTLTQHDADEVYARLRLLFVDPDWMPAKLRDQES